MVDSIISTVIVCVVDASLPAVSVVVIVRSCVPSANADVVTEYLPSASTVPLPTTSPAAFVISTLAPASPVPSIVGVLSAVILSSLMAVSEPTLISAVGFTIAVSKINVTGVLSVLLPAVSVWRTTILLSPSTGVYVVVQSPPLTLYSTTLPSSILSSFKLPLLVIKSPFTPLSVTNETIGVSI